MRIFILHNFESAKCLSYIKVKEAIEKGKDSIIYTNCLDFANFDYLEKVEDVEIIRRESNGALNKIILSELLENNRPYTDKHIRKAHNVRKMLVAGKLNFLPEEYKE